MYIHTLGVDVNNTLLVVMKVQFKKWDTFMTITKYKQQFGIHNMECFERVAVA